MHKTQVILIPGNGGGTPQDNWFPWLEQELTKFGFTVINKQFPDAELARAEYWLPFITELGADEHTMLIGHSSGAVAAMRYAESHKLYSSVLVGAYYTDLGYETEKQSHYYDAPWQWDKIKANQNWIIQFASTDDPFIPIGEARHIHEQLETEYYEYTDRGHFGQGSKPLLEFPELLEKLVTFHTRKALIIPINSDQKIFIQDRRGHKPPDWGYFGGGIEPGETPVQAVIRETKEELDVEVSSNQLIYLGTSTTIWNEEKIIRYMFLYPTENKGFNVLEGKGGYWFSREEVRNRLDDKDRFDEIWKRIFEKVGNKA